MLDKKKRAKRRRQEALVFSFLVVSLLGLLLAYGYLFTKERGLPFTISAVFNSEKLLILKEAKFSPGQQVMVMDQGHPNYGRIGLIADIDSKRDSVGKINYQLRLSRDGANISISEDRLDVKETLYRIGDRVEILDGTEVSKTIDGLEEKDGMLSYFLIDDQTGERFTSLETDLVHIINVPMNEGNTAKKNNEILQGVIEESKNYTRSVLNFPKGTYQLGSHSQEDDYILLASNIELRGNETTFIIDGASRWLGLATGPTAYDGVSNVIMSGFNIVASDLEKGSQFVVMLNHGSNWRVYGNSFTMVHPTSSHVFDLGGVIEFQFIDNKFIGYAPDMAGKTQVGETEREKHHIYSEAIQLDAGSTAPWDGHTIRRVDPNFEVNNPEKVPSSYVTITQNEFLPYLNSDGDIIAYSATVGQHYEKVGPGVIIQNNRFVSQLADNFNIDFNKDRVFLPVHAESDYDIILEPNIVE